MKIGLKCLKIFLGIVNILLSIIIIVNILLILSEKVLKTDYPSIMDYSYYVAKKTDEWIDVKKGDFLLIDTREKAEIENIMIYQYKDIFKIGKVMNIDTNIILKDSINETTISNELIIGKVIYRIPKLGMVLENILKPIGLLISIILLTITVIIEGLINKKYPKEKPSKPNFKQTW